MKKKQALISQIFATLTVLGQTPSCFNGLSLTEHIALDIISKEKLPPYDLFERYQNNEESHFLGDSSFWQRLNGLIKSSLITIPTGEHYSLRPKPEQQASITNIGRKVLLGEKNNIDIIEINRWIGGVHLTPEKIWHWNRNKKQVQIQGDQF